jgi:AcrR family transcriptional regulator
MISGAVPPNRATPSAAGAATPADPSRAQQRRERERLAAQASILVAAGDLGRSEGWDAVTMRRLADRLEYSANFAYRYFTGRDDILLGLVRDGFSRLRDAMAAAADSPPRTAGRSRGSDPPPAEWAAIRRPGHAYLDFALADPDLYQLMYGLGGTRVPATDAWNEGQAVGDVLIELLRDSGDTDPDRHVLQLWATTHGLIALFGVGRVVIDVAVLHAIVDDAISDVLTRTTGATPPGRVAARPVRTTTSMSR